MNEIERRAEGRIRMKTKKRQRRGKLNGLRERVREEKE